METELKEKLRKIEDHFGGAGIAAKVAGVTATSWSRWKNPEGITPTGPRLKLINLLYEQVLEAQKRAS
jgi:hypothetical protein